LILEEVCIRQKNAPVLDCRMTSICEITIGLIGQICWGVEYEKQLNLKMSFGKPRLRVREPYVSKSKSRRVREIVACRNATAKGEWWLWIFCAYWRIVVPNSVTATSSSPLRVKRAAMGRLSGQRLKGIRVNTNHVATHFAFDLGATLEVRRMEKASDADVWTLYKPNGYVLGVRGDGTFTYNRGTTPGSQLVPIPLKAPESG
jgi:hypothetical protein